MKNIKLFDSFIDEPKIGDYVICEESFSLFAEQELDNFISNNIGTIIKIEQTAENVESFYIHYYNIPENILYYFSHFSLSLKKCRLMYRKEIIFFSPNIEDCEIYLTTKNFNL